MTRETKLNHSFDMAAWSRLTGAPIIGSKTTCLEAEAQHIPAKRCTSVYGGEKIAVTAGVVMRVVRWNHSGDHATNPEQHDPVELTSAPHSDTTNGGLRGGVAEDFPNGGGSRGFLFVVDGPQGRFSWFFQNSASAVDLETPIVIDGKDYGAPLENLRTSMRDAGLESVDLWIGTGGTPVAKLVLPVLRPKAYLPVHWDGLYGAFEAGVPRAWADAPLEQLLREQSVALVRPLRYMDKWRLDPSGIRPVPERGREAGSGIPLDRSSGGRRLSPACSAWTFGARRIAPERRATRRKRRVLEKPTAADTTNPAYPKPPPAAELQRYEVSSQG